VVRHRRARGLAAVASRHGGRYISHIRSEDYKFDEAIDEILAIGRRAHIGAGLAHQDGDARTLG
jgi:N-acyl-D-amino-acid deacylase